MERVIVLLAVLFWAFLPAGHTQYAGNRNALAMKKTFLDHYSPVEGENGSFANYGGGWEISYYRNINPWLNAGVPVKIGIANLPGESKNRTTLTLDFIGQAQIFDMDRLLNPFAIAGFGLTSERFRMGKLQMHLPVGGGLNYNIFNGAFAHFQVEYRVGLNEAPSNIQYGLGVMFLIKKEPDRRIKRRMLRKIAKMDRDGDFIIDRHDRCPDEAGVDSLQGCPDTDLDGLADQDDLCPGQAGPSSARGCPDRDADGIPDHSDPCPDKAGTDGRPCPLPEGHKTLEKDVLPAAPDPKVENENPLPKKEPATPLSQEELDILKFALRNITFATNEADLNGTARFYLGNIVEVLKKYPDIGVNIKGHTDNLGPAELNLELSRDRAKACYEYLLSQGLSEERLSYAGFGEQQPIADNSTRRGRKQNRRVEFELVDQLR